VDYFPPSEGTTFLEANQDPNHHSDAITKKPEERQPTMVAKREGLASLLSSFSLTSFEESSQQQLSLRS
jgi:hypothetical protein